MKSRLASIVFVPVLLVAGCGNPDSASLRQRAIDKLKTMPPQLLTAKSYSPEPVALELTSGEWVGEMVTLGDVRWDYRPTDRHSGISP
jgi:hypothetical protein